VDLAQARGGHGLAVRDAATVRIDGNAPAELRLAGGDQRPPARRPCRSRSPPCESPRRRPRCRWSWAMPMSSGPMPACSKAARDAYCVGPSRSSMGAVGWFTSKAPLAARAHLVGLQEHGLVRVPVGTVGAAEHERHAPLRRARRTCTGAAGRPRRVRPGSPRRLAPWYRPGVSGSSSRFSKFLAATRASVNLLIPSEVACTDLIFINRSSGS